MMGRIGWGLALALLALGLWRVDANPIRLVAGLERLGLLLGLMWPPSTGGQLGVLLRAMADTVAMAFLGTLLGALIALPLALVGAANLVPVPPLRFALRRSWDGLRTIDGLVWALIFVAAVGMGPFAGVLALAVPDIGTLAKLYAEELEAADPRQAEAVRASGGGALSVARFGVLPQALPVLLSQTMYFFESNTRSASILGVVGAGGIGLQLSENLRLNNWPEVAAIILLILAAVAVIDTLCRRLRRTIGTG